MFAIIDDYYVPHPKAATMAILILRDEKPMRAPCVAQTLLFRTSHTLRLAQYLLQALAKQISLSRDMLFVGTQVKLMKPASIYICNGSFSEAEQLTGVLEKKGVLERLEALDNVFVARTDPADALEKPTFICTKNRTDVEAR
ncbi:hypothetical protein ANCCEY_14771 [Ancylostoma ceylanicum]|uniref:Phosphoenolpyruvate carboxykinase GTP-utilising N-terminal domain-containing protein n=1 Tax=Ancylostoma ceylanicum TaxID=53326 RepID=A0A0D6L5Y0_9BILA|nr:hypothetical protein ANCCEY_14771 [Ancylostoma ceylanicum]